MCSSHGRSGRCASYATVYRDFWGLDGLVLQYLMSGSSQSSAHDDWIQILWSRADSTLGAWCHIADLIQTSSCDSSDTAYPPNSWLTGCSVSIGG